VAVFFFAYVTAAIGFVIGQSIGGTDSYAAQCAGLVGLWAGLIPGSVFVSRVRTGLPFPEAVGLRFRLPFDLIGLPVGIVCTYLLDFFYWVASHWIHHLQTEASKPAKELTQNAHGFGFFVFAILLVVGAPVVEEIFYRGLLLRSLKRYLSPTLAVVVCGVVFGAAHLNLVTLAGLAGFGIVLAYLANRFGRLGPNILAHSAFNLVAVIGLWAAR
jgi:membrane protease YdiL (CAAX protease family)